MVYDALWITSFFSFDLSRIFIRKKTLRLMSREAHEGPACMGTILFGLAIVVIIIGLILGILSVRHDVKKDKDYTYRDATHWVLITSTALVAMAIYYMHVARYQIAATISAKHEII